MACVGFSAQLSGEYETVRQSLLEATQKQQSAVTAESDQLTKLKKQVGAEPEL